MVSGVVTPYKLASAFVRPLSIPRSSATMQYGDGSYSHDFVGAPPGWDAQQGYVAPRQGYDLPQQGYGYPSAQQGYPPQQDYGAGFSGGQQGPVAQATWRLEGSYGVTSFTGVAGFPGEHYTRHFQQDYYGLPYTLQNGDERVLSRWNMVEQSLTVSRKQCKGASASARSQPRDLWLVSSPWILARLPSVAASNPQTSPDRHPPPQ